LVHEFAPVKSLAFSLHMYSPLLRCYRLAAACIAVLRLVEPQPGVPSIDPGPMSEHCSALPTFDPTAQLEQTRRKSSIFEQKPVDFSSQGPTWVPFEQVEMKFQGRQCTGSENSQLKVGRRQGVMLVLVLRKSIDSSNCGAFEFLFLSALSIYSLSTLLSR